MNVKETVEIAMTAGEILLCSGSEIYRVEDTITRICSAYDIECEAFVMPTGIFISGKSISNPIDTISLIKRIKKRTIDLHCIELINTFSRGISLNPLTYSEAIKQLNAIKKPPYFKLMGRLIAAAITAFAYCILFKGNIADGITAAGISALIYYLKDVINKAGFTQFFEYLASGLIAGGISLIAARLFPVLHMNEIIIGAIMILVPGVTITNGIRDALHGDLVASIARLGEALFIVTAVGAGVGFTLAIGMNWM